MLQCQQIFESGSLDRMSTILHSLDQLFPVRFDTTRFTMWAVGHGAVGSCQFMHVFSDWRAEFHGYPIYGGSGLGRFEVIPTPERKIKYRLAMRIIKIVEPVVLRVPTYDGYVHPPTPGELVTRGNNGKRQNIWSVGLDTSSACHKNIHLLLPKLRNLTLST
ncbi:hypothetical protein BD779DRAFT_1673373 [Infundibulicybe gibba]|nr:hypothetical protein BD779DRAFT_1673373 [Infundibulicybe gibba]